MEEALLEISSLQVSYGDFLAVNGASLAVAPGSVTALIGANGAGKSTLLNAAVGLLRANAGRVRLKGEDITGFSPEKILSKGLCLVPQGSRCFLRMSVEDNLLMGSYAARARGQAKKNLERVYSLFPILAQKRGDAAGSLSGGQRQMTAIGRAFMAEPDCILFDEISLGLAPVVIHDIYSRIRQINEDRRTAILLVEQDIEKALVISDTCYVMLHGAITLSGPSAGLDYARIRSAYFGL